MYWSVKHNNKYDLSNIDVFKTILFFSFYYRVFSIQEWYMKTSAMIRTHSVRLITRLLVHKNIRLSKHKKQYWLKLIIISQHLKFIKENLQHIFYKQFFTESNTFTEHIENKESIVSNEIEWETESTKNFMDTKNEFYK